MQKMPDQGQPPKTSTGGWCLIAESSRPPGKRYVIPANGATIGHDRQCDIVVIGSHVSKQHAHLHFAGSGLVVCDLDSANGTFVNDNRINQCALRPGDRLRLDVYSFRVAGPKPGAAQPTPGTGAEPAVNSTSADSGTNRQGHKQWITKPTSPGNRKEAEKAPGAGLMLPLSIGVCAVLIAVIGYILITRL